MISSSFCIHRYVLSSGVIETNKSILWILRNGRRYKGTSFDYSNEELNSSYVGDGYINITAYRDSEDSHSIFRLTERINVNFYNTIKIDWENIGTEQNRNESHLVLTNNLNNIVDNNAASLLVNDTFQRDIDKIDISSVKGSLYIAAFASYLPQGPVEQSSILNIYNIWLEA